MTITAFFNRARRSISGRYASYRWRVFEGLKPVFRSRFGAPARSTVFIFGCQRSGTTHMERLFRADPRSVVHGEFSDLSVTPDSTLWMPFDQMRTRIDHDAARYVVIRSLLASHRAVETLEHWPDAAAFWVFRDANSVVDSMIRKWGGNFFEISKRVESAPDGDWDLANLWQDIQKEARSLAPDAEGDDHIRDVYALFWLHRNQLVYDLDLAAHPRVIMVDYADFTAAPEEYLDHGLAIAGVPPVGRWRYGLKTRRIDPDTTARKPQVSPPIQARCDALYQALRQASATSRTKVVSS